MVDYARILLHINANNWWQKSRKKHKHTYTQRSKHSVFA